MVFGVGSLWGKCFGCLVWIVSVNVEVVDTDEERSRLKSGWAGAFYTC